MSNYLAVAVATATLREIIFEGVNVDVSGISVTTVRPNAPAVDLPVLGVNLYLYQTTPNNAWRNADLPTRRANGELAQQPKAAIDLHYLLSFYGDDKQLEPQRLLGSTIRSLHEQPLLSRAKIRQVIATAAASTSHPYHAIKDSDLDGDIEMVKLTPLTLNLEELSKLWSVFFQTTYSLSVAYQATVILLESKRRAHETLPVRESNVRVIPFRRPVIESITPQIVAPGETLTLRGQNLAAAGARIFFDESAASPSLISDQALAVIIPSSIQPGIRTAQVRHDIDFGTPDEPHRGLASNLVAFGLAPVITTPTPITVAQGATGTLAINPPVARGQMVTLLIGDQAIIRPSLASNAPPTATTLDFAIPASFPTGNHLLRLEVDGVQSRLIVDTNPASPTFEQYIGPLITIT